MAAHYKERGPTPLTVGLLYSRYPAGHLYSSYKFKLLAYSTATGCCKLRSVDSGYLIYMSDSEVTNWHIVSNFITEY